MSVASGALVSDQHHFPIRVYYEDTDAVGVVYHSDYLKFAERARTEMLRLAGVQQSHMVAEHGVSFVVRDCQIEYLKPACFDDLIEVRSRLLKLSGASVSAEQLIWRGGDLLVRIAVRVAALRKDGRPTRIPTPVRQALERFVAGRS